MAKRKYETSRRTNLRDVHTFDQPCQAFDVRNGWKADASVSCPTVFCGHPTHTRLCFRLSQE